MGERVDCYRDEPGKTRRLIFEDIAAPTRPVRFVKTWRIVSRYPAIAVLFWSLLSAAIVWFVASLFSCSRTADNVRLRNAITFSNGTIFEKPRAMRFVGLVFYGRRQFADILD